LLLEYYWLKPSVISIMFGITEPAVFCQIAGWDS